MIRHKNLTPFLFGYRPCSRQPPAPEMTCIVRGKFTLVPGQPLVPAKTELTRLELDEEDEDPELEETLDEAEIILGQGKLSGDVFVEGDDERAGELIYPSDLAEFKLGAEVMLRGTCHPPSSRGATSCLVSLSVGAWTKQLRVVGPRVWVDKVLGGKATEPLVFESMPLGWAHAFGGSDVAENPVGKGRERELPNVEPPDQPVSTARSKPAPAGFGPINPAWPQRHAKLGKNYGETYQKTREPYYSDDFDWRYLHAAPADQQFGHYLRGDEKLRFVNLHPEAASFRAQLPGIRIRVFVLDRDDTEQEVPMVLDTLFADLDDEALYLTWRGVGPVADDDLMGVQAALVVQEQLADRPGARAEYFELLRKYAADPVGFEDTKVPALQKLQEDIESGAVQADIQAMPEDERLVPNILDRIVGPLLGPDQLGALTQSSQQSAPSGASPAQIKQGFIDALEQGQDPPPLRMGISADGEVSGGRGPLAKEFLRELADSQKEAMQHGVDMGDINARIEEQLQALDDPEIQADQDSHTVAAMQDRPLVEPAPRCDLSWQDLSGRDLSGVDLTEAKLEGANLARAKLIGATLVGANLSMASLSRADLSEADCRGADFTLAGWSRAVARGANLTDAKLDQGLLLRADLSGACLDGVSAVTTNASKAILAGCSMKGAACDTICFDGCELDDAVLSQCHFHKAMFRECRLVGARFDGAELSSAGFLDCDLSRSSFVQATGERPTFMRGRLAEADFSYARLTGGIFLDLDARRASFAAADLPEVRFYRAILRQARFDQANLLSADLRKTSLTKATFRKANLYESRFMEAFGTDADFKGANLKKANFRRNKLVTRS